MNNNFNSLNNLQPQRNLSPLESSYEVNSKSTTLNGRTLSDLTHSSQLSESMEKTITSYESFQELPQPDPENVPELYGKEEKSESSAEIEVENNTESEDFFTEDALDFNSLVEDIPETEMQALDQQKDGMQKKSIGSQVETKNVEIKTQNVQQKAEANIELKQQIINSLAATQFGYDDNFLDHEFENFQQQDPAHPFSPETIHNIVERLMDKGIKTGGFFKRGPNGERLPLTQADIQQLREVLRSALTAYFNNQVYSNSLKQKLVDDRQVNTSRSIEVADLREGHAVALLNPTQHETAEDKHVNVALELALLAKLLMSNIMTEHAWEKKVEEEREQKILDLIDSIKQAVIKREILNQEILHREINSQEIKSKSNKFIELPVDEAAKITNVYNKFHNGKAVGVPNVRLQLPGLHKMKSMVTASA